MPDPAITRFNLFISLIKINQVNSMVDFYLETPKAVRKKRTCDKFPVEMN